MGVSGVDDARRVIERAIADRTFPAAAVEVGSSAHCLWRASFGAMTFGGDAPAPVTIHTPFDLASLTKVIATTSVVMELVRMGTLRLDEPVAACFDEWRGRDREEATVRDLLEHASGLPARLVDAPPQGRREFEHDICTIPLEYAVRSQSIYSDLGFILLGFLIEDRGRASLAVQVERLIGRLKPGGDRNSGYAASASVQTRGAPDVLTFVLSPEDRQRTAPTLPLLDDPRRGRMLAGEVHDNYAAALGGVAGHAGMFGTAPAIGELARVLLGAARGSDQGSRIRLQGSEPFSPETMAEFTTRSQVAGSSRALGWDTMLLTSSCGTRMSLAAFGHVGFTGTSLWIDPVRDRYFVLLTNRACGGGSPDQMRTVRRAFHDALGEE